MPDGGRMPEQWIIRVQGKEYGPADVTTLREWKKEGRVIAANEARPVDVDPATAAAPAEEAFWSTAAKIPGLFEIAPPPVQAEIDKSEERPSRPQTNVLAQTFRIYGKGFFKFLGLTFLIIGPSICAELTRVLVEATPNVEVGLRHLVEGAFAFCMLLLTLMMWPVYVAGIQIITADLAGHRPIGFLRVLNEAARFWPRIAFLSLFVYGSYLFWSVLLLGIVLMLSLNGPSLLSIFFALALLFFWIWLIGRLWVNFLFWQQCAVLDRRDVPESLRCSKELARSEGERPWFERPMWRAAFLASLWIAVVLAINWPMVETYFRTIGVASDPQALMEAVRVGAKSSTTPLSLGLNLLQWLLRPLLGIAFVLLYLDSKRDGA
jgi:hypothetical protein